MKTININNEKVKEKIENLVKLLLKTKLRGPIKAACFESKYVIEITINCEEY